jgi:hypothetical protein
VKVLEKNKREREKIQKVDIENSSEKNHPKKKLDVVMFYKNEEEYFSHIIDDMPLTIVRISEVNH